MKHYFKIALLAFVASLNLHGSPLPENTPVASNPSAEKVWEKEVRDMQEMIEQRITEALKNNDIWTLRLLMRENSPLIDNIETVQNLIKQQPTLIYEDIFRGTYLGKNLAVAQFIHSEMKKQGLPFTGLIFINWLKGAAYADAVDVVTWLLETIAQFDVKSIIGTLLNASDIVPGGKVETYLKKTGLFDSVKSFGAINKKRELFKKHLDQIKAQETTSKN